MTELHYSQLFFVVGHVAIKMLTYIEQIEQDMKKSVADAYQNRRKNSEGDDDDA